MQLGSRGSAVERSLTGDVPLRLESVSKTFHSRGGEVEAVRELSLEVPRGEFVTVVGPSGCGKSTLMNLIVGLVEPTSGTIYYDGRVVDGINTEIGYVTQDDNLFPWRTVLRNVEFGMEVRHFPAKERRERALRFMERVGLRGFEKHYPHELSGGMRQRANIIRTLCYNPKVILMDEPFGPLDAQTRLQLQAQLLDLWHEQEDTTIVFITHDLVEAIALADRVIVMTKRPGQIKKVYQVDLARPRDVYTLQFQEDFQKIYRDLWAVLETEVRGG